MAREKLFEVWAKRNPQFEIRYEESIVKLFTDYGKGRSSYQDSRGKIFGAGYEIYIIAFFIGLYYNKRRKLNEDNSKRKVLGQPIQYWGQGENRNYRRQYSEVQKYIFAALIARSDIDLIALDQDKINVSKAASILIDTMEEYANFGFDFIKEKMEDNPEHFFRSSAFLDVFMSFTTQDDTTDNNEDVESLD